MLLLRVFDRQIYWSEWNSSTPELNKLLASFELPQTDSKISVSCYSVSNFSEELEVAAALLQRNLKSPEKLFGVCVDSSDCCTGAGLELDDTNKGETGIDCVDIRHVDLKGTRTQFGSLIKLTLSKIIGGDHCLRVYSAYGIAGQLAVFSRCEGVSEEARSRCRTCLEKQPSHFNLSVAESQIEISGHLKDQSTYEIVAHRSIMTSSTVSTENVSMAENASVVPESKKWYQKFSDLFTWKKTRDS